MNIESKMRFCFDMSGREYSLIINALKKSGGNGIQLASELESFRSNHWKEIMRRYKTFIAISEGKNEEDVE